ncbi:MAG: hypothetical protein KDK78_12285, partial [Chlamydiia bacterium]|nr:hypothetical protein [Chlamydiia bacterium]
VFNTKLKQVYPPVGAVAFKLEGEPILAEGTFVLDKMVRLLDPRRPAYLKWKVTPDRYQVLKKFVALLSGEAEEAIADLELVQPTEMEFFAKRLSLPAIWFHRPYGGMTIQVEDQVVNTSDWDASQLSLDFDLGFKDLNFRSPKLDQTLRFNELKGFIAMPSITEKLVFGVLAEGQLSGAATGEEPSVVTIKGQLWDLVEGEDKQIQFKTASTKLWATLSNVPATLLGDFFVLPKTAKEHLQAFFGEKLNAYVQADLDRMAGPITAKLDSSHTKGDLEAELIDGALLLKNDLEFAIDVTPDTGEQILRYFNPLLITAIKADKPLEVRVTAKGFKLPVIPLDIAGAQFADATVSIGKVTMRNDGPMGSLVKVLQLTRFTDSKDLEVWFTPLYLAMEDGVLTVKRVDFLVADHFHMATWGKMDLAKDRLGLVAGLSGDTLRSAFKIKGLPDTYVLQISLKGNFSKPKID